jgi:hypothetical protein
MEWYVSRLRCDQDGDVAHEFLELDNAENAGAEVRSQQTGKAVNVQEVRIENGTVICE